VLHQGKTLAQLAQQYTDNLRLVVYNRSAGRGSNAGISHVCCFMVDGGGGAEGEAAEVEVCGEAGVAWVHVVPL
jgi:hypothetical protein